MRQTYKWPHVCGRLTGDLVQVESYQEVVIYWCHTNNLTQQPLIVDGFVGGIDRITCGHVRKNGMDLGFSISNLVNYPSTPMSIQTTQLLNTNTVVYKTYHLFFMSNRLPKIVYLIHSIINSKTIPLYRCHNEGKLHTSHTKLSDMISNVI